MTNPEFSGYQPEINSENDQPSIAKKNVLDGARRTKLGGALIDGVVLGPVHMAKVGVDKVIKKIWPGHGVSSGEPKEQ